MEKIWFLEDIQLIDDTNYFWKLVNFQRFLFSLKSSHVYGLLNISRPISTASSEYSFFHQINWSAWSLDTEASEWSYVFILDCFLPVNWLRVVWLNIPLWITEIIYFILKHRFAHKSVIWNIELLNIKLMNIRYAHCGESFIKLFKFEKGLYA